MSTPAPELLLAASDVALLAGVRRPVVSMWRARLADSDRPFPEPCSTAGRTHLFDAYEVADWLVETGHGKNPSARDDVPAFATFAGVSHRDDPVVFAAVTAALCLVVLSGETLSGLDAEAVLDLADECDPDDQMLYAELEAAADRLPSVIRYAELITDSSTSPAEAFERLMRDRFRTTLDEHKVVVLNASVGDLVARTAVGLAARSDGSATYADPCAGSSDLLMSVLAEHGERGPVEVLTASGDHAAARLVRRRLRVNDVYRTEIVVDEEGGFSVDPGVTHIVQLPHPARPSMSDEAILDAVDQVVLQMDDAQRGVVVAPASALSDGFGGPAEARRAELLRSGRVRAVVRLAKGLVPARSRQALAIWILGDEHRAVSTAERVTMVGDLADVVLSDAVIDDLATDLIASAAPPSLMRAHAYAHLRPVHTRTLVAARSSLVEAAPAVGRQATGAATLQSQLERAYAALQPLDAPAVPVFVDGSSRTPMRPLTVSETLRNGSLRVVQGTRCADEHVTAEAGLRVIGVGELTGGVESGGRHIDPLLLAAHYPSARLTEPGDVVFCTSPRPAAFVDHQGASVVVAPARVLRLGADPDGLRADVVAADINRLPRGARTWRQWRLRRVGEAEASALTSTLAAVRDARAAALERVAALDAISDLLLEGVTTGALTLEVPHTVEGH
ncbi:hypothetical protein KV102_07920 [Mumia sp. zg.B53]|uniref:hypothetical protein n=1 Tax=Mumia sp. zg.B53 TaxID=2855449 RepID=UPI001C6ECA0E|nr:hypothetical protein [Mumia sp. zg.B53]MBW9214770.1 hypothetical protein [Mumia sp. zg.B53]